MGRIGIGGRSQRRSWSWGTKEEETEKSASQEFINILIIYTFKQTHGYKAHAPTHPTTHTNTHAHTYIHTHTSIICQRHQILYVASLICMYVLFIFLCINLFLSLFLFLLCVCARVCEHRVKRAYEKLDKRKTRYPPPTHTHTHTHTPMHMHTKWTGTTTNGALTGASSSDI